MERAILVIVLIVALVGVVGLFSTYNFGPTDAIPATSYASNGVTGNVVAGSTATEAVPAYDCNSCAGYAPVCAKLNNRYITFANACEASCSGARLVREFACERI